VKKLIDQRTGVLLISILLPVVTLLIPRTLIPIDNISVIEQRVLALFVFAALFWILEPIPIYATSILIIVLELLMISDNSLVFLRGEGESFGHPVPFKEIMATMASPVILLFLGGFFLAAAATKYRLDQNIARVLLNRLGTNPGVILLGIMTLTAFISMFMSNTATTAMMLSILIPVLNYFPKGDKGRMGFVLAVPVAANLGGIGTPIGTPPNAIALKFLNGAEPISFAKWMAFGVPFVVAMLLISWLLILLLYPVKTKKMEIRMEGTFNRSRKAMIVYATFIITISLWLLDFIHGLNAYTVAMIPVGIFLATGIINKEDLKMISWEVLWLVAGGIALGLAIESSGLAKNLITSIPFGNFNPYTVVAVAALSGFFMANFMSNTATANLLLPLLAALGASVSGLEAVGGAKVILLGTTFAISLAMALPISTPPNALAHATGEFRTKELVKVGLSTGLVGLIITTVLMVLLHVLNFFS
jgi:solute carrier family 13 (sodium-dependent dicarboxylate transporter), member 2/3/5